MPRRDSEVPPGPLLNVMEGRPAHPEAGKPKRPRRKPYAKARNANIVAEMREWIAARRAKRERQACR